MLFLGLFIFICILPNFLVLAVMIFLYKKLASSFFVTFLQYYFHSIVDYLRMGAPYREIHLTVLIDDYGANRPNLFWDGFYLSVQGEQSVIWRKHRGDVELLYYKFYKAYDNFIYGWWGICIFEVFFVSLSYWVIPLWAQYLKPFMMS